MKSYKYKENEVLTFTFLFLRSIPDNYGAQRRTDGQGPREELYEVLYGHSSSNSHARRNAY